MTVAVLERADIGEATGVLDVGCGAGQTLRVIEELNKTALLVGVDPDETSCRCGRQESGRIHFLKGEGERLPLADATFSHVVCRVAINYMHQETALRELARVLAPGGTMILAFHGIGFNLRQVLRPWRGGLRQWLGDIKDLLAGMALQLGQIQARRGTFWGHSAPYTSCQRLRHQLRERDCTMTWLRCERRFLGTAVSWWTIITKSCSAAIVTSKSAKVGQPESAFRMTEFSTGYGCCGEKVACGR
ncbi:MAG TPA: class I SAM-dependent methyltransferase [Gemmataceae bacterium]|nr:class I SAM-dependent methyltransferase [Gemmataceae bacterium]